MCDMQQRLGGSSSYSLGSCPATAKEAAAIVKAHERPTGFTLPVEQHQALLQEPPVDAGCCFSFGYGARMKPCCLKAEVVHDAASCKPQQRLGGESSFTVGQCPANAQEAASIFAAQSHSTATSKASGASLDSSSSAWMMLLLVAVAGGGVIGGGVLLAAE